GGGAGRAGGQWVGEQLVPAGGTERRMLRPAWLMAEQTAGGVEQVERAGEQRAEGGHERLFSPGGAAGNSPGREPWAHGASPRRPRARALACRHRAWKQVGSIEIGRAHV